MYSLPPARVVARCTPREEGTRCLQCPAGCVAPCVSLSSLLSCVWIIFHDLSSSLSINELRCCFGKTGGLLDGPGAAGAEKWVATHRFFSITGLIADAVADKLRGDDGPASAPTVGNRIPIRLSIDGRRKGFASE